MYNLHELVNMGNNSSNRIPKLRFLGFHEEWVEKACLGEVIDVCKGQQVNNSELTKDSSFFPMLNGGSSFSGYYSKSNTLGNTITISEGGNSCGFVNRIKQDFWAGGHCYVVKPIIDINEDFLFYLLKHKEPEIMKLRVGSGLPNIQRKTLLNEISVSLPNNKSEQEQIAECLKAEDEIISAQEQKIESLKAHKIGLMQQLFPQPGTNIPSLRFPGFKYDWTEKKLGEILNERKEVSVITANLPQLSFTIEEGVIKPENRKTNQRDFLIKDKDNKRYAVTRLNDIIYNPANVVFGAIHKNNLCDGVVSPIYKIFWTKENADFLNYLLRRPAFISLLASRAEGTVTKLKTLKAEAFLDMPVPFPVESSEQNKIASCFLALDDIIQAESEKLEALKAHKKGLMRQLFPQLSK